MKRNLLPVLNTVCLCLIVALLLLQYLHRDRYVPVGKGIVLNATDGHYYESTAEGLVPLPPETAEPPRTAKRWTD